MFMRICLLLLFLIGNAYSSEIEIEYKVLPVKSVFARRADVKVSCNLPCKNSSGDFVLTAKRCNHGVNLIVSFRGRGISIYQPIRKGQRIEDGKLEKVDPLSGDIISSKNALFKNGKVKFQNLSPDYIYRLSYKIVDNSDNVRITSPKVYIIKDDKKAESPIKESLDFTIPVFFQPGSFSLDSKAKYTLDRIKKLAKFCRITVIGYADNSKIVRSNVPSNKELAKLRAISVKNYLIKREY